MSIVSSHVCSSVFWCYLPLCLLCYRHEWFPANIHFLLCVMCFLRVKIQILNPPLCSQASLVLVQMESVSLPSLALLFRGLLWIIDRCQLGRWRLHHVQSASFFLYLKSQFCFLSMYLGTYEARRV